MHNARIILNLGMFMVFFVMLCVVFTIIVAFGSVSLKYARGWFFILPKITGLFVSKFLGSADVRLAKSFLL